MEKKHEETIYLQAVPLEWISEPDKQELVHQILSYNTDKLLGTSSKYEAPGAAVQSCPGARPHTEE